MVCVSSHAQTHQKVTNISVDTRVPLVMQMAKMAANSLVFKVVNKIIRSSHVNDQHHLLFESSPVRNYHLKSQIYNDVKGHLVPFLDMNTA